MPSPNSTHPYCPLCGETRKVALTYGGYDYQGARLPLVECPSCGLKYIDALLDDQMRASLYNEHVYFESAYAGGGGQGNYVENKSAQDEKARTALSIIARYKPGGSFFEIGCAGGYLLLLARERGYQVSGVELSEEMAAHARASGLDVVTGELADVAADKKFDCIYLGDVIEHVHYPLQYVRDISAHLAPGGILAFEVPLSYNLSYPGIVSGVLHFLRGERDQKFFLPAQHRGQFLKEKPYHLSFFNRWSLETLVTRAGLTVRLLSIYEGPPKQKFEGSGYSRFKRFISALPRGVGANRLGDRAFVVAEKI